MLTAYRCANAKESNTELIAVKSLNNIGFLNGLQDGKRTPAYKSASKLILAKIIIQSRLRFGAIPSFADTLELLKLKSFSAQNWTLIQSSEFDSFVQEEPYNAIQVLHNVITGQTLLRVWGRTVLRTRLRDRALLTQLCWQAFHKTTACHGASLGRPDMTGESKTSFYQDPSENCRSRHCELWYKSDRVKGDMCLQCLQVIAESSSDARRYAKSFVEKQEEEEDTDRRETDLQIRTKWEGEEEEEEEEVDTGVFQSVEAIDFDDLVQVDREQLEEIDEDCQSLGSVGDMLDSPSLSASPDFDGQDQANDDVQIETDEEIFNVRKESLIVAAFSKIKEAKKRVKVDKIKAKRRKRQSSDDAIFQISGAAAKKRRVRVTEPTIKCQLCENRFTSEIHLSRHLNQKHAYSWYTCLFCDFVARYPEDLTNHYLETEDHERPEQVSVPCCGKYFPIHLLAKHCQKCFSACHVCRKKVKQITKKIHMRHKHAAGCHQCPLCEFSALFPKEIVDHIGAVHPATDPKDVSCPQCRKGFPADKYDSHCKLGCCEGPYGWLKTVTCHICGRLVDRNMYQDHMDQSHVGVSTREMVCSTCAVRSHEVGRFLCHLRVRHAYAVYRCVRCRFVCGLPEELVKHCKEAHEKCPAAECPKCCDDIALASFGEHVAVCVAKWNTCKECGKGFTTTKGLDKHLNLSVSCGKARCTFCDVCGKEVSKATLNRYDFIQVIIN
jgi:hypothetical protein